jgi:hypothetical protein
MDIADLVEMNNNMELLRTGNFADCTFIVGPDKKVWFIWYQSRNLWKYHSQQIKAHKIILMRNSRVFEKLFSAADQPSKVKIASMSADDLNFIFKYVNNNS